MSAKRKHWYFISVLQCVLCGQSWAERERRYTRRPKAWSKRHEFEDYACSGHFL